MQEDVSLPPTRGLGVLRPTAPLLLPRDAQEPGAYCARTAKLQQALGDDIRVPGQPVLWMAHMAHLRQEKGPLPPIPHTPLWWAGNEWRELSENIGTPHAQVPSAYEPRRFHPPSHSSGLFRPLEVPGEAGPEEDGVATYPLRTSLGSRQSGVWRALRAMLCQRTLEGQLEAELWARPTEFGEWKRCPHQFPCHLARTEAFEVCDGDMYVFLFRSRATGACGLDTILLFNVARNEWLSLVNPTNSVAGGLAGDAPVRWRPVEATSSRGFKRLPLRAWLLESSPDHLILLSPVSRDGVQRGDSNDVHSAVHFIGRNAEVVSHHMACHPLHLTLHRYVGHMLFIKDFDEHPCDQEDACLDNNWHPSYPGVAAWLLNAEDVAVPPLPVHLPITTGTWGGAASSWSLVLARGSVEDLAPSRALQQDTAPRLYLLEMGSTLQLWASRRIDAAFDTLWQRLTFDGPEIVRHSLGFQEVPDSAIELADADCFGMWALWSPEIQHVARVGPQSRRLLFWRCAVTFAGGQQQPKSSMPRAYRMAAEATPWHSLVEEVPLHLGWQRYGHSSEYAAGGFVVSGLPNFPTMRWQEADFHRPEDHWMHPVSGDAAQHAPSMVLR